MTIWQAMPVPDDADGSASPTMMPSGPVTSLGAVLKGEAKDAVVFTGSSLVIRFGSLLLLPLYWTRLSPADYGILAVIAVIGVFQGLLGSLSLDLAITRFYYEWTDDVRRRNLGAIWVWNWICTVVVGGAFLLAFVVLGPVLFPDVPYDPWLFLGIIGTMLANLFLIPASTIRIMRLPWVYAAYSFGAFALTSGLGLWLVLVQDEGLFGLLIATILSNLVMAIVGGIVMLRISDPSFTSPGLREAFRFALPAQPAQLILAFGAVVDRLLLSQFASLHTLGVYAVAMRFVDVLIALHISLKMSFGPFMMRGLATDRERGSAMVVSIVPYYMIPYFAVALGLSLFIGPLVQWIGQPEYFDVIVWVPWLAGVAVVTSLYFYYANGMFLGNRNEVLSLPALVRLGAMVVTGVLLVPAFQLAGIVVSRYVSELIFLVLCVYLSQRYYPMAHRWGALGILAATAIAFAIAGEVVALQGGGWEVLLKAVLWVGFLGLSWLIVGGGRHRGVELPAIRAVPADPGDATVSPESSAIAARRP